MRQYLWPFHFEVERDDATLVISPEASAIFQSIRVDIELCTVRSQSSGILSESQGQKDSLYFRWQHDAKYKVLKTGYLYTSRNEIQSYYLKGNDLNYSMVHFTVPETFIYRTFRLIFGWNTGRYLISKSNEFCSIILGVFFFNSI